jgi:chitosanase
VVEATYFGPAVARAGALGLRTPLGLAILYDTIIQHGEGNDPDGLPALIKRTNKRLRSSPATGLDEGLWLNTFLRIRRADLRNPSNEATRREWANSVPRVDVLGGLLAQGNYT